MDTLEISDLAARVVALEAQVQTLTDELADFRAEEEPSSNPLLRRLRDKGDDAIRARNAAIQAGFRRGVPPEATEIQFTEE